MYLDIDINNMNMLKDLIYHQNNNPIPSKYAIEVSTDTCQHEFEKLSGQQIL